MVIEPDVKPVVTTNAAILPPCNRAAESVEGVYDVRELMSSELLDSLEYLARGVMAYSEKELSEDTRYKIICVLRTSLVMSLRVHIVYFTFFRFTKFFPTVLAQIDKKSVINVKMLIFADSLIQFLNFPARGLYNRKVVICQYSSSLNEKLINDFCTTLVDGK